MPALGKTHLPVTDRGVERLQGSSLAEDLSFLLARANALALAAANSALAQHGLKARSYSVLALAADVGPTQRELADFLRLDPSQVVTLVDELEKRNLVQRRPDPTDRRANVVVATDAGRALFVRAQRSARTVEKALRSALTPADQEKFAALMHLLAFPADNR
jgi:DNA-binding MarR family transcriptional regulator